MKSMKKQPSSSKVTRTPKVRIKTNIKAGVSACTSQPPPVFACTAQPPPVYACTAQPPPVYACISKP